MAVLAAVAATAQTQSRTAEEWIEQGKTELARYSHRDAEAAFRQAIALNPDSAQANVLLARALIGQLPLNLMLFPDSEGILPKAEQAANRAVELAPSNPEALCVAGIVNYKIGLTLKEPRMKAQRLTEALKSFQRALSADSRFLEAHLELAHMAVDQSALALMSAYAKSNKQITSPAPLADAELRRLLRARYSQTIQEGMSHASSALEIDPKSEPAMHYMMGLLTVRAALQDNQEDFAADWKQAQDWQQKEAALRAARQSRPLTDAEKTGGVIGGIISSVPTVPPPPPPPVVKR
jgi:hypothetical protein